MNKTQAHHRSASITVRQILKAELQWKSMTDLETFSTKLLSEIHLDLAVVLNKPASHTSHRVSSYLLTEIRCCLFWLKHDGPVLSLIIIECTVIVGLNLWERKSVPCYTWKDAFNYIKKIHIQKKLKIRATEIKQRKNPAVLLHKVRMHKLAFIYVLIIMEELL